MLFNIHLSSPSYMLKYESQPQSLSRYWYMNVFSLLLEATFLYKNMHVLRFLKTERKQLSREWEKVCTFQGESMW